MPTQQNIGLFFGNLDLGRAHENCSEVIMVWVLACSGNQSTRSSGTRWLLASGILSELFSLLH